MSRSASERITAKLFKGDTLRASHIEAFLLQEGVAAPAVGGLAREILDVIRDGHDARS
jgi:hypothetical protein